MAFRRTGTGLNIKRDRMLIRLETLRQRLRPKAIWRLNGLHAAG